jgi:hypothetical protein
MLSSFTRLGVAVTLVIFCLVVIAEDSYRVFLTFGPNDHAFFLGQPVDTWFKTVILWLLGLIAGLGFTYYTFVMERKFDNYIWNPAIYEKEAMPFGWKTGWFMLLSFPVITFLTGVMGFFMAQTGQLQFIIPEMVGSLIILYPSFIAHLRTLHFQDSKGTLKLQSFKNAPHTPQRQSSHHLSAGLSSSPKYQHRNL